MAARRGSQKPNDPDSFLVKLGKLTSQNEDFLTECVAASLAHDRPVLRQFLRALYRGRIVPSLPRGSHPTVRTQQHMKNARPDLVIEFGRRRLLVENKLGAPETPGQLQKYLDLPGISNVAMISAQSRILRSPAAVRSRKLLSPPRRHYFLWGELYPIFAVGTHPYTTALVPLMDHLRLQPSHPLVGPLDHPDPARQRKADTDFAEIVWPALRPLEKLGWELAPSWNPTGRSEVWIHGQWSDPEPSRWLAEAWFDPIFTPASCRLRLKATSRPKLLEAIKRLDRRKPKHWPQPAPDIIQLNSKRARWAVEIVVPWRVLLDRCQTTDCVGKRVRSFVVDVLRAAV